MKHSKKARELFLKGYNCAQAVFVAFSDVTGLSEEQAYAISTSFGGGMGHTGEACGAVTGMYMAVGMILGYKMSDVTDAKQKHYKLIKELSNEFKAEFSDIRCPELLTRLGNGEYNIPADEAYEKRPCLIFVEKAAEMVERYL
ncbi:MAG: C_GCAxxG_C_C family protein [Clostridia bacterium]|nr:C_GCAxxG_C_C family protein [Clostridia bacterium]